MGFSKHSPSSYWMVEHFGVNSLSNHWNRLLGPKNGEELNHSQNWSWIICRKSSYEGRGLYNYGTSYARGYPVAEEDNEKRGNWNADGCCEIETDAQPTRWMHEQDECPVVGVDHGQELVMHLFLCSKCSHRCYTLHGWEQHFIQNHTALCKYKLVTSMGIFIKMAVFQSPKMRCTSNYDRFKQYYPFLNTEHTVHSIRKELTVKDHGNNGMMHWCCTKINLVWFWVWFESTAN